MLSLRPSLLSGLRPLPTASRPRASPAPSRPLSTARRSRNRLRQKASPLSAPSTQPADHIIYAPPSAAPNVYHTPAKFLPARDPRRKLAAPPAAAPTALTGTPLTASSPAASASAAAGDSAASPSGPSGILLRAAPEKKYHLTDADFDEIRRLRAEDPATWTVAALADKFGCSKVLITMVAPNAEARARHFEAIAEQAKRRAARTFEDRQRRRELWKRL